MALADDIALLKQERSDIIKALAKYAASGAPIDSNFMGQGISFTTWQARQSARLNEINVLLNQLEPFSFDSMGI